MSSADSLCKQFGPRSGPPECSEKVHFEKVSRLNNSSMFLRPLRGNLIYHSVK